MKSRKLKRILAMVILIAMTVGLFQPMGHSRSVKAETVTEQEKKIADETKNADEIKQDKKEKENSRKKERKFLKEKYTEDSTTYEEADGKKTIEFYGEAVRFMDTKTKQLTDSTRGGRKKERTGNQIKRLSIRKQSRR